MYDDIPGWHITIDPIYFFSGMLLSILGVVLLVCFIAIIVFKIKKEKYEQTINIANLVFCILSTVLLVSYLLELIMAWYSGYFIEQYSYLSRAIGPYWISYLVIAWVPLLLTQLFWLKKNRVNIKLALFIVFMFNLHLWFEKLYIIVISLMRQ